MLGAEWFGRMTGTGAAGWIAVLVAPFVGSFLGVRGPPPARGQADRLGKVALRGLRGGARRPRPRAALQLARDARPLPVLRLRLGWFYPGVELAALAVAIIAATRRQRDATSGSTASSAGGCSLSAGSTRDTGCCPTR